MGQGATRSLHHQAGMFIILGLMLTSSLVRPSSAQRVGGTPPPTTELNVTEIVQRFLSNPGEDLECECDFKTTCNLYHGSVEERNKVKLVIDQNQPPTWTAASQTFEECCGLDRQSCCTGKEARQKVFTRADAEKNGKPLPAPKKCGSRSGSGIMKFDLGLLISILCLFISKFID